MESAGRVTLESASGGAGVAAATKGTRYGLAALVVLAISGCVLSELGSVVVLDRFASCFAFGGAPALATFSLFVAPGTMLAAAGWRMSAVDS
jgi:hypothetical protein